MVLWLSSWSTVSHNVFLLFCPLLAINLFFSSVVGVTTSFQMAALSCGGENCSCAVLTWEHYLAFSLSFCHSIGKTCFDWKDDLLSSLSLTVTPCVHQVPRSSYCCFQKRRGTLAYHLYCRETSAKWIFYTQKKKEREKEKKKTASHHLHFSYRFGLGFQLHCEHLEVRHSQMVCYVYILYALWW